MLKSPATSPQMITLAKVADLTMTTPSPDLPPPDNGPDESPILGSWRNMYIFVLVLHALIILLFYLFTRAYS